MFSSHEAKELLTELKKLEEYLASEREKLKGGDDQLTDSE